MKKKIILSAIIILLILSVVFVYKIFFGEREYNVLFLTLDTTRADHIDTGNGALAQTPIIKKIAANSTVCKNAYTVIPITMPSHTTIFTGKYPHETGVYNNGENYTEEFPTLAEIFKQKGYKTGAIVSLGVLMKEHKLNKGFDYYSDDFSSAVPNYFLTGNHITERGIAYLDKVKDKKFFLWLHYSDPHEPYGPPRFNRKVSVKFNDEIIKKFNIYDTMRINLDLELKEGKNIIAFKYRKYIRFFYNYSLIIKNLKVSNEKKLKVSFIDMYSNEKRHIHKLKNSSYIEIESPDCRKVSMEFTVKPNLREKAKMVLYRKEVEYMDSQIGRVIEYLKLNNIYKNTIIVLVGDHGEGLGEYHRNFGHIHFLRPQYIRVPLIIKFPTKSRNVFNNPISTVDIAPTLINYMRFKEKNLNYSGIDIIKKHKKKSVFAFTYKPESFYNGVTILNNDNQYIKYEGKESFEEFIDLKKTKGYIVKDNIINNKMYFKIIKKMRKFISLKFNKLSRKTKKSAMSEKTKNVLKSLGYL